MKKIYLFVSIIFLSVAVYAVGPGNIVVTPTVTTSCSGTSNGMISINVTGTFSPFLFAWTGPSGFTSTSQNLNGLITGSYHLVVTDAQSNTFSPPDIYVFSDLITVTETFGENPLCIHEFTDVTAIPSGGSGGL